MSRHEFYADPTLFDQWQSSVGSWVRRLCAKLRPYAWVYAFAIPAALLASVAVAQLAVLFHHLVSPAQPAWNLLLAEGIALVVALAAARRLSRHARGAWPRHIALKSAPWRLAGPMERRPEDSAERKAIARRTAEREALQRFFSGVKASGVNVAAARALLAGGIRSPRQLRHASDRQLTAIPGVGVATVRKLRRAFCTEPSAHPRLRCGGSVRR